MLEAIAYTCDPLDEGWSFKQGGRSSTNDYLPANNLPTDVFRDLLKNNKIEDPFQDLNELSVRWVGDQSWTYRTTFLTPAYSRPGVETCLRLEGLDTFASVYLNGKLILTSENMFVEHRIKIGGYLKRQNDQGGENVLEIVFESARCKGLELVEKHKEHRFIVHQTEISRGPVRKAQYHWGWDWGPILMTAGPWKPVWIETYTARIEDIWVEYTLSPDLKSADAKVNVHYEGAPCSIDLEILNDAGEQVHKCTENITGNNKEYNTATFAFKMEDVQLWWPKGYGNQSMYTVLATLHANTTSTGEKTSMAVQFEERKIGFRKVALMQYPDAHGTSFYFRVNNVDVFCGGSCWIPTDSFLSRIDSKRYVDWIKLAAEGNQTMVRVWGGGAYEGDAFYNAADEFGVLIWQDFMFACANYPAHPEYLESVELEAQQNVRRLRSHPSIVLWAGNNEDYQIVERYGLEYQFEEDKNPESWLKTDFPARYIYEHLLPKVVKEEAPGVPYHPSSPWGNGTSTVLKVDSTVGDIHQWNVWHGTMHPYQQLPDLGGRFVSEFGMEAYPHIETLERVITKSGDRYPGSMAMDFRNKAIGHERRLVSYVAENFRIRYDLESFVHLTQIMQADALSWAYKSWRRKWQSGGDRRCGGVLVWQLNDCYPTMSWAVVDYYLVPKPAYYAIKRALEPVVVGVQRKFNNWTMRSADNLWQRDTSHIDMRKVWEDIEFDVWVASHKTDNVQAKLILKFISVKHGKEVHEQIVKDVSVKSNATTEVVKSCKLDLPGGAKGDDAPFDISKADPFIICASLHVDGIEVASDVSWPEPIKYLSFPDRGVEVNYSEDKSRAVITAKRPVKGFVFDEKQEIKLSDNGFDLVPGEKKEVVVEGSMADTLKWRYVEM